MIKSETDNYLLLLLRLGAFFCFAGWTWGHIYWGGPYDILMQHDVTSDVAELSDISRSEPAVASVDAGFTRQWIGRIGWLYLVCSILTLTVREKSRLQMAGLIGGSGLLVVLSYAKYLGSQKQLPMFVEHGGQVLMPVLLVLALSLGVRHRATVMTAIIGFCMTFAGHGCFALGLWPTPAAFHAMTSTILGVEYETANVFLRIAGVLDFIVCVGILIPVCRRMSTLYAAIWGLLTALARPVAGMSLELDYWGCDQFLHEAVLRAPHFMIPLYLFFKWSSFKPHDAVQLMSGAETATAAKDH